MNIPQKISDKLSQSFLLQKGRNTWEKNLLDWEMPLTRWEKLQTGLFIILKDYAEGSFPPTFDDQQKAYEAEIESRHLPGKEKEYIDTIMLKKPFWGSKFTDRFLRDYVFFRQLLEKFALNKDSLLLEIGCGSGWMAEFLAIEGFKVIGTTLSPYDLELCQIRKASVALKNVPNDRLLYRKAAMETLVDDLPDHVGCTDLVYVYEALHHAYSWEQAIDSIHTMLRPGGYFFILNEPGFLHTFKSYRVSKLKSTHEIGFSKRKLVQKLKNSDFEISYQNPVTEPALRSIWIVAKKIKNF